MKCPKCDSDMTEIYVCYSEKNQGNIVPSPTKKPHGYLCEKCNHSEHAETEKIRNSIIKICEQEEKLRIKRENLTSALQTICSHEAVIETPPLPRSIATNYYPSMRICAICGFEEEGNSFRVLTTNPIAVIEDRHHFFDFRKLRPLTVTLIPAKLLNKRG